MGDRLYKKKGTGPYLGWFYDANGQRIIISTRTFDRRVALKALQDEEQAARGIGFVSDGEAVEESLSHFLRTVKLDRAEGTCDCYKKKAGHIKRLLGDRPIAAYEWDWSMEYIEQRGREGAQGHTIKKELTVLRGTLRIAMARRKLQRLPVEALVPRFRVKIVPVERYPEIDEWLKLREQFPFRRVVWISLATFCVARASVVEAMEWGTHYEPGARFIKVPGTKTPGARRGIPVAPPLAAVLDRIKDKTGRIADKWSNVRRDLSNACKRAQICHCSPNDLRRAFGSWMRQANVDKDVIAQLFGHQGTALVDSTYAFYSDEQFVEAVRSVKLPSLGDEDEE